MRLGLGLIRAWTEFCPFIAIYPVPSNRLAHVLPASFPSCFPKILGNPPRLPVNLTQNLTAQSAHRIGSAVLYNGFELISFIVPQAMKNCKTFFASFLHIEKIWNPGAGFGVFTARLNGIPTLGIII